MTSVSFPRLSKLILGWGKASPSDEVEKGALRGGKKRPTVGRPCDLPWVGETTDSRFFRRPSVGRFLRVLKDGAGVLEKEAFRWVERAGKKCR